jgi:hypothetical protein
MKETLAIVASLLAIVGNVPYLIDVLKKRIEPHAYTWFIWSIVSCVIFFGQVAKGAGIGALPTAFSEVFTIIIFFFSLRNGFRHIKPSDHYFLVAALLGLIPWAITKDPTISVIVVVSMDLIAFVPTLRKTYAEPQTEKPLLFATNVIRHALALVSLRTYNIATTLHSISMIVTNTIMTVFILRKKRD